jgi:hypothetical protein
MPHSAHTWVNDELITAPLMNALETDLAALGDPYTAEQVMDAVAAMFAAGTMTGVTFTYNDATNSMSVAVTGVADATATAKGIIQLAGDLGGTAAAPVLASIITAGSVGSAAGIPVISYDAKGRITAVTTVAPPVTSVAGRTGAITLAKGDVGLGNVDNTSDVNKPVSTAQQTALNLKLDASAAYTDEKAQDAIAAMLAAGTMSGITFTYNDALNKMDVTVTPGSVADATTTTKGAIQLAGDLAGTAAAPTLAAIITAGTTGSTTAIPVITYDAKGRITGVTTAAVPVTSVAGRTGAVTLTSTDVGLANVNNTSDANKPVSTAQQTALNARLLYRGAWTASTAYAVNDVVINGNTSYVVTTAHTSPATFSATNLTALFTDLVTSVAGRTGAVTLTKTDVGLANVDNTSDANKPVSTAQQTALDAKVNGTVRITVGTVAPGSPATNDLWVDAN